jgi:GT2 family glycosyltransferase
MPGNSWGPGFLQGILQTVTMLAGNGIEVVSSAKYSALVDTARNMCAGGAAEFGVRQKPFNGKLDYDFMLWIDSDQTFTFDHFATLMERQRDICAGWCCTISGELTNVCLYQDEEKFKKQGHYDLMPVKDMKNRETPFKVDYCGFAFILIKKGVFESITYPWFSRADRAMDNGVVRQIGEDVSFCNKVREAGFSIWVDPTVRVGHTKSFDI